MTQSVPNLPLNNIFWCRLAANNTTCVCVCKYFERLRHNAPGDRNPNVLKYKTKQKSGGSSCDPTLSMNDNVNHHQDNTRVKKTKAFYDWATTGIPIKRSVETSLGPFLSTTKLATSQVTKCDRRTLMSMTSRRLTGTFSVNSEIALEAHIVLSYVCISWKQ